MISGPPPSRCPASAASAAVDGWRPLNAVRLGTSRSKKRQDKKTVNLAPEKGASKRQHFLLLFFKFLRRATFSVWEHARARAPFFCLGERPQRSPPPVFCWSARGHNNGNDEETEKAPWPRGEGKKRLGAGNVFFKFYLFLPCFLDFFADAHDFFFPLPRCRPALGRPSGLLLGHKRRKNEVKKEKKTFIVASGGTGHRRRHRRRGSPARNRMPPRAL